MAASPAGWQVVTKGDADCIAPIRCSVGESDTLPAFQRRAAHRSKDKAMTGELPTFPPNRVIREGATPPRPTPPRCPDGWAGPARDVRLRTDGERWAVQVRRRCWWLLGLRIWEPIEFGVTKKHPWTFCEEVARQAFDEAVKAERRRAIGWRTVELR